MFIITTLENCLFIVKSMNHLIKLITDKYTKKTIRKLDLDMCKQGKLGYTDTAGRLGHLNLAENIYLRN